MARRSRDNLLGLDFVTVKRPRELLTTRYKIHEETIIKIALLFVYINLEVGYLCGNSTIRLRSLAKIDIPKLLHLPILT